MEEDTRLGTWSRWDCFIDGGGDPGVAVVVADQTFRVDAQTLPTGIDLDQLTSTRAAGTPASPPTQVKTALQDAGDLGWNDADDPARPRSAC